MNDGMMFATVPGRCVSESPQPESAEYNHLHAVSWSAMKRTTGWAVVRLVPWHLLGIFPTSAEARIRCLEAGPKYVVHFGEGNVEENDFSWIDPGVK